MSADTKRIVREIERDEAHLPLCHAYFEGFFSGTWTRACDGARVTDDQIKAQWQSTNHPHDCTQCIVCRDIAAGYGVKHGDGSRRFS